MKRIIASAGRSLPERAVGVMPSYIDEFDMLMAVIVFRAAAMRVDIRLRHQELAAKYAPAF